MRHFRRRWLFMAYNFHITRARRWPESEFKAIEAEDWLALVEGDPQLTLTTNHGPYFAAWNAAGGEDPSGWLDWKDGEVFTANPSAALTEKMAEIARQLGATLQGDDGELYRGGGAPPEPLRLTALEWIRAKFEYLVWGVRAVRGRAERERRLKELAARFQVGQRVKTFFGNEGVVTDINCDHPPGLGRITVRFSNGKETHFALAASGLLPAVPEKNS